jgi:hypothetical protein
VAASAQIREDRENTGVYHASRTTFSVFTMNKALKLIVIFVISAQNDCFLLAHENEFLVETVRSRLEAHPNAPTKQSSRARNTNTILSTTAL